MKSFRKILLNTEAHIPKASAHAMQHLSSGAKSRGTTVSGTEFVQLLLNFFIANGNWLIAEKSPNCLLTALFVESGVSNGSVKPTLNPSCLRYLHHLWKKDSSHSSSSGGGSSNSTASGNGAISREDLLDLKFYLQQTKYLKV